MFSNVTTKPFLESLFASKAGGGLLGPAAKPGVATGLLGGAYPASSADLMQQYLAYPASSADLMQQYLAGLHRRRYNPPAIAQQPGMVGSQMGAGGMQYMAPQVPQMAPPGKTEMQRLQEQLAQLQAQMNPLPGGIGYIDPSQYA